MFKTQLRTIFMKTNGHCHFCGDLLFFENRGWCEKPKGHWEVDHVTQRAKGGADETANYLPACTRCNRLRWHRTGEVMRDLLLLGVLAQREIRYKTSLGKHLELLRTARLEENEQRRRRRRKTLAARAGN